MNWGAAAAIAIGFGIAGWKVGLGRGRPWLGATLGALAGLVGLLILVCIPRTAEAKRQLAERRAAQPATDRDAR